MGIFESISGAVKNAISDQQNNDPQSTQANQVSAVVKQLYENSNDDQKQAMLRHVHEILGPQAADIAGKTLGITPSSESNELTPDQLSTLTPEQVQTFISLTHQHAPELTEHLSNFYSEHTDLLNTVGAAALAFIKNPKKIA